jgi:hypothetical protein
MSKQLAWCHDMVSGASDWGTGFLGHWLSTPALGPPSCSFVPDKLSLTHDRSIEISRYFKQSERISMWTCETCINMYIKDEHASALTLADDVVFYLFMQKQKIGAP